MRKWLFRGVPIFLVFVAVYLFSPSSVQAANCTWKGGDGSWNSTPTNWNGCGSTYPKNSGDTAKIDNGTVTLNVSVGISKLTVTQNSLSNPVTYGTLTADVPGPSVPSVTLTLQTLDLQAGGTIQGAANIVVNTPDAGNSSLWSGGTMAGSGATTINARAGILFTVSGSPVLNRSLTVAGGTSISGAGSISGTGTFNNNASLAKISTGTFTISGVTFNNTGAVSASETGILEVSLSATSTGTYSVANTATLRFLNTHTFASGANITGTETGTVEFTNGGTVSSTYNVAGTTLLSGGTLSMSGATLTSLGATLTVSAGTLNLGTKSATVGTLNWTAGTLSGDSTIPGNGTLTVSSKANINGTLTLTAGTINSAATVWDSAVDGSLTGAGTYNNTGTFSKTGAGKATIGVSTLLGVSTFHQVGTVTVSGGVLEIALDTASTGKYIANGAVLRFTNGHSFLSGADISADATGTIEFYKDAAAPVQAVTIVSTYDVLGTTIVSGSDVDMSGTTAPGLGGELKISSGSLNLGALNVSVNKLTWSGGAMLGAGKTTISTSTNLSGTLTLTARTLESSAATVWASALDGSLTGTGIYNNTGTFSKTGAGKATIGVSTFHQVGTVTVSGGVLEIALDTLSTGKYIANGAVLRFTNGHSFLSGADISADSSGTIEFYKDAAAPAQTVTIASTYAVLGTTTISGSDVVVSGAPTPAPALGTDLIISSGSLDLGAWDVGVTMLTWSGGAMLGTGKTTISTSTNLSGTLTLTARTLESSTAAIWSDAADGKMTGTGVFNSLGTFSKSGTGKATISPDTLHNTAAVSVSVGTLELGLDASSTGTYNVSSGATLRFTAAHTFASGADFSGAGNVEFGAGAAVIDSAYDITGTTKVTGGTLRINTSGTYSGPFEISTAITFDQPQTFNSGATFSGAGSATFLNTTGLTTGTATILLKDGYALTGLTTVDDDVAVEVLANAAATGPFSIPALSTGVNPGSLLFSGDRVFGAGANVTSAGQVEFKSGTISFNASTYDNTSTTIVSGASLDLSTATAVPSMGSAITLSGGSLDLGAFDVSTASLTWSGGEMIGNGVTAGSGTTTVSGGLLDLGGSPILTNRILTVTGAGSSISWLTSANDTLSGSGTLNFDAPFTKYGGGDVVISANVVNTNLVTISGGTLALKVAPGSTGTYQVETGTTFKVLSAHTFGVGENIGGAGNVEIKPTSGTVVISSNYTITGTLTISSGTLKFTSGQTFLVGSDISGAGNVEFAGGTTNIASQYSVGGTTTISGGTVTLSNLGLTTGPFVINSPGVLSLTGDHTFGAGADFSGDGTLDFPSGTVVINGSFNFTGTTSVSGATLTVSNPVSTGPFTVSAGKIIFSSSGSYTFTKLISGSGAGEVAFSSGTFTVSGGYDVAAVTTINGASVSLNPTGFVGLGSTLNLSSGSLNLNGLTPTVSQVNMSGGTLTGSALLTVVNMTWSDGTQSGIGSTSVTTLLNLSGTPTLNRTLTIVTAADWTAAGTLDGTGTLNNQGTLTKDSTDLSTISVASFDQADTVNVTLGSLKISPLAGSTGIYTVGSPGVLVFGGAFDFDAAATLSGTGEVQFTTGTVNVNSPYNVNGKTTINGGTVNFTTLSATVGPFVVAGGTLHFSTSHAFGVGAGISGAGTVDFGGGTITIGGPYAVTGTTKVSGAAVDFSAGALTSLGDILAVSAGSLNLGALTPTVTTLNLSGGSLTGTGDLTVTNMTWSGGALNGSGSIGVSGALGLSGTLSLTNRTITSSGTMALASNSALTGTGILNNNGSLTKSGNSTVSTVSGITFNSTGAIYVTNGTLQATLASTGAGPYDASSGATLILAGDHVFGSSSVISGAGKVQFPSGTVTIGGAYTVSGETLAGGDVSITYPAGASSTGAFNISGTLHLGGTGTHTYNSGAKFSGAGTLDFTSGSFAINSEVAMTGAITVSGATVDFSGMTLTSFGNTLNISAGTAKLGGETPTIVTLNLSGGTLDGSAALNVTNANWSGGTQSGSGSTSVTTLLNLSGTPTLNRTLTIVTAADWTGAGTLDGTGTLNNQGTLTKDSSGLSIISVASFNQADTVTVTNGSLEISPLSGSTGVYSVTSPGVLIFGGAFNFGSAATLSGTGEVQFTSGIVNVNSAYNVTGKTTVNGGTVNFTTLSASVGPFAAAGGTLHFSTSHVFGAGSGFSGAGTVDFGGGTITITAPYTVTGTTKVSGAAVDFTGAAALSTLGNTLTVSAGSLNLGALTPAVTTLNLSGTGVTLTGSGLLTASTMNWSGGNLTGAGTTEITTGLNLSGTLDLERTLIADASAAVAWGGAGTLSTASSGIFTNNGTMTKSSSGVSTISQVTFNHVSPGVINVSNGTLAINPTVSTGTYNVTSPGVLSFTIDLGKTITYSGGVTGNGTIDFGGQGKVIIGPAYSFGGAIGVSGATVDFSISGLPSLGTGVNVSGGLLELGGLTTSVANFNMSGGSLAGTGTLTVDAFVWSGGNQTGSGTTLVKNRLNLSGTMVLQRTLNTPSATVAWDGVGTLSDTGTWNNGGPMLKAVGGLSTIAVTTFVNTGAVDVTQGTLAMSLASGSTGTYSAVSPGKLKFTGTHTFGSADSISGSGDFEFANGPFIINNQYAPTGNTLVSGTLTINYPAAGNSSGKFVVTGTLHLVGTHTFNTGADFSGTGNVDFLSATPGGVEVIAFNSQYNLNASSGSTSISGGYADFSGATLTSFGASLVVSSGTLNVGSKTPSVAAMSWHGGTMTGSGSLSVSSTISMDGSLTLTSLSVELLSGGSGGWTAAGSLTGSGTFKNSGSFAKTGAGAAAIAVSSFINNGSLSVSGGSLEVALASGSTGPYVSNQNALLRFKGPHTFVTGENISGAGAVDFVNGPFVINSQYLLVGGTTVNTAVTINYPSPKAVSSGSFIVGSGKKLSFSGDHEFSSAVNFTGTGDIDFVSGAVAVKGGYGLTGQTRVLAGDVTITFPTALTSVGPFVVNGGLHLSGDHTFDPGAKLSGTGKIEFVSGTINVLGEYAIDASTGTTELSGATLDLSAAAPLTSLGANLTITAGSLNLGSANVDLKVLRWSSGTITGNGGNMNVAASGQAIFTGGDFLLLNARTLTNNGSLSWDRSSGDSYLYLANAAALVNSATGTMDILNSGSFVVYGTGSFSNAGTLNKNNANTAIVDGVSFENSGTVNSNAGVLQIGSFATTPSTSTGAFTALTGATLRFAGTWTHTFGASSNFGGAGTIEFKAGTYLIDGTYNVSGGTAVSGAGALVTMNNAATLTKLGDTLDISAGELDLNSGEAVALTDFALSGGSLGGTDVVTVDNLTWTGGTQTGLSSTRINKLLSFTGGNTMYLNERQINLLADSVANWTSTKFLYISSAGGINIAATATFNVVSGSGFLFYGAGVLTNEGTLNIPFGQFSLTKFVQKTGALTKVTVKGLTAGNQYGQIRADTVELAGDLQLEADATYSPVPGTLIVPVFYNEFPKTTFDQIKQSARFPGWVATYKPNEIEFATPTTLHYTYLPVVKR